MSVVPTVAVAVMYAFVPAVRVGSDAFCVACAGVTIGTNTNIPDSASRASMVPELTLLRYIEDVFKYVFGVGRSDCVYK